MLEARIIAVADVVEAMSAHRPYRPAMPFRSAVDEMRKGAGVRYDERVAAALLALWRRDGIPLEAAHAAARHRRRDTDDCACARRPQPAASGGAPAGVSSAGCR